MPVTDQNKVLSLDGQLLTAGRRSADSTLKGQFHKMHGEPRGNSGSVL